MSGVRIEHDSLGEKAVPQAAYWGVQTARAVENFPITGVNLAHYPALLRALAMVKMAAARANSALGKLSAEKAGAIVAAAQEVIDGKFHDQFPVDVIQGGAGTSTNMNMNEVLANRALELMGHARGDYHALHPNDDVNPTGVPTRRGRPSARVGPSPGTGRLHRPPGLVGAGLVGPPGLVGPGLVGAGLVGPGLVDPGARLPLRPRPGRVTAGGSAAGRTGACRRLRVPARDLRLAAAGTLPGLVLADVVLVGHCSPLLGFSNGSYHRTLSLLVIPICLSPR